MSELTAVAIHGVADLLEQILVRMPTAAERFADEERRAWDGYVRELTASHPGQFANQLAAWADKMLAERRKRFPPPGVTLPAGDTVSAQRSLLEAIVAAGKTEGLEGLRPLLVQLGEEMK